MISRRQFVGAATAADMFGHWFLAEGRRRFESRRAAHCRWRIGAGPTSASSNCWARTSRIYLPKFEMRRRIANAIYPWDPKKCAMPGLPWLRWEC
jgi:hypothetical protein